MWFQKSRHLAQPPRCVQEDAQEAIWLSPGFLVELHLGDAEGYYLNATTEQPCFWVVLRVEGEVSAVAYPLAIPQTVTLSYHDAGRWLDAQETVEQVPAPGEVVQWLRGFVDQHYVPETKKRQRPLRPHCRTTPWHHSSNSLRKIACSAACASQPVPRLRCRLCRSCD